MTVLDPAFATDVTSIDGGVDDVVPNEEWAAEVRRLARQRGATVLAHNYQLPEIQDVDEGSAALQQTLTRLLARITGTRGCCG